MELEPIRSIEKLRNVLKGHDTSVSRTKAISMLPLSDFPNKEEELGSLLENSEESDKIRHMAAEILGRFNTLKAREILIKNTETANDDLLATVVIALARYGDLRAINAISKVKQHATRYLRTQATFAAALISHRMGLEGNELPPPEERGFLDVPNDSQQIIVEKANAEELKICFRSIGEKPFGLALSERPAYQVNLGTNSIILLNRDFTVVTSIKTLGERKAIPGIIAQKKPEDGEYFVSYLILTSPRIGTEEINIWFARSYGKISFGGKATLEDGQLRFSIRSISQVAVFPIMVDGSIRENSFELRVARFSPRIPIQSTVTKEEG